MGVGITTQMKNLIAEICMWILWKFEKAYKGLVKHILNTRGGFLTVGLILGITSIIILHEGKSQIDYIQTGLIYSREILNRASAEEVPETLGGLVSTDPLQEGNQPIPNKDSVEELITHFFQEDAKTAKAIAMCESSLNPKTIGDTHMEKYSYGLFQINRTWHDYTPEQLLDPEFNCKVAKEIFDKGGWERWSCFKNNNYKKYLTN